MKHLESDPRRQLRSLCAMGLLSPALRLIPGAAARAGRAVWAGPLAALPLLLLFAWAMLRLRKSMRPGESFPALLLRLLGRRLGRAALLLLGGWLLLYGGFTLRACAERFQITVYPHAPAWFFILTMGMLALLAALRPLKHLARTARMVEPLLLAVLALILVTALRSVDATELLPLTVSDTVPLLLGSLPALEIGCFGMAAYAFFCPVREGERPVPRRAALWLCGAALLLTALGAAVQGHFGAALSERLSAPFFALVRNLRFFRSLERIEALVVGFWIFPDFLLTGISLHGCLRCLRLALGLGAAAGETGPSGTAGAWLPWVCGGTAIALGLLLGRDPVALLFWSRELIPLLSLSAALFLIPGLLLVGKLRRRL